jgi:hypothetical protein
MTGRRKLALVVLTIAGLSACAGAQGATLLKCSNRMIKGTYGFTCTGTVAMSQTANVPFAQVGVVTSDGRGHFEGPSTTNINGGFAPQYVSTTGPNAHSAVVNPDCTGTVTYEMYSGNPNTQDSVDLGPLPITFVVMDNGNQIRGMPTVPGFTVTCQLIRVHQPE